MIVPLFVIGITSEFYTGPGRAFFNDSLGDFLYQPFQILVILFVFPRFRPWKVALFVFVFNCLIECSQLIQTPALYQLRGTLFGRLFLGNSFSVEDFLAYILGAVAGLVMARQAARRPKSDIGSE